MLLSSLKTMPDVREKKIIHRGLPLTPGRLRSVQDNFGVDEAEG